MPKRPYPELEMKAVETLANGAPTYESVIAVMASTTDTDDYSHFPFGELVNDAQKIVFHGRAKANYWGFCFTNRDPDSDFVLADLINNQYPESPIYIFPGGDDADFGPYTEGEIGVNEAFGYQWVVFFIDAASATNISGLEASLHVERFQATDNMVGFANGPA
jgi:hypothetical protein